MKSYRKSNLNTTRSQLPDLLCVESSINKRSSHCSHRLFVLDWAFTEQDTSIGFQALVTPAEFPSHNFVFGLCLIDMPLFHSPNTARAGSYQTCANPLLSSRPAVPYIRGVSDLTWHDTR